MNIENPSDRWIVFLAELEKIGLINFDSKVKVAPTDKWVDYTTTIIINDKPFKLVRLYSPSPTARKGIGRSSIFKKYLLKNPNSNADDFRIDLYKKLLPSH